MARSSNGNRTPDIMTDEIARQLIEMNEQLRPKSPQDLATEAVLAQLDKLAGDQLSDQTVIFQGTRFVVPEALEGNLEAAVTFLDQIREAEETEFEFTRTYPYRPWDGAAAFQRAMLRVFGTSGVGKATFSFFGTQPPQYISIEVGVGTQLQVPWGRVAFAPIDAVFSLGIARSPDGILFQIEVMAPKKHRRRVEGFMTVIEDELRSRSIYRGKAIDAQENPEFVDLTSVDPAKVIYARDVRVQLEANLWSVLTYAEMLRATGTPLKRAVLLEGQYGSGKTLTGVLTGQRATYHGWTFIQVRSGDDPYAALRTAKLYAPAVVWVEDLDVHLAGKPREEVSKLLDALDNVQNKGAEVVVGFTTNFPDVLEKGVLRPGRIDAVIHFGSLDPDGYERLVRAVVPHAMLGRVDFGQVSAAFEGFLPAFAAEAAGRAIRYSVVRGQGKPGQIVTEDLVSAAEGLRPQLEMLDAAGETRHSEITIESLIDEAVTAVLLRADVDGEEINVKGSRRPE